MRAFALPILAAAAIVGSTAASAAEITIATPGPVVELGVSQSVRSRPDLAVVTAGVQSRAATADAAARANAAQMDTMIAKVKALGIAERDIQTSNYNLNPQWQYNNEGQPPRFLGYDVSNQVSVRLRDLKKIGATLDALIAAGANSVNGPSFTLENDAGARSAARKAAFQEAQGRAKELAALAGYSGLRLLEVSESYASPVRQYEGAIRVTAMAADKSTPIEPGEVETSATLTVKYEMTR